MFNEITGRRRKGGQSKEAKQSFHNECGERVLHIAPVGNWKDEYRFAGNAWRTANSALRIPPRCSPRAMSPHRETLESFFYLFSVWDETNRCLSWDATREWAELLGCPTPGELYRGPWAARRIQAITIDPESAEGYVVRLADGFAYADFPRSAGKWVRPHHVKTDDHWMHDAIIPNRLRFQQVPGQLLPIVVQTSDDRKEDEISVLGMDSKDQIVLNPVTKLYDFKGVELHSKPHNATGGYAQRFSHLFSIQD